MIRILKQNSRIKYGIEKFCTDENDVEVWNIPTNIDEFKSMAIDTINWEIGDNVKKALGNTQTNLSASNAKGIVLVSKVLNGLNPDLTGLTDLEKDSFNKMVTLGDNGYADSQLLNASLSSVSEFIASGTAKVARVTSATTIDEVIDILNEV